MRKHTLATILLLPFLLSYSHAAQSLNVDSPVTYGFPSEESGTTAYLGVDINDVTTERMSALKLKEEKGVEVTMVDQDAPAGKAGIKEHDVILTMNGESIQSGAQLRRMIHETPAGRLITLGVSRDGQPLTVKVQLADRHQEFSMNHSKDLHIEIPPIPSLPEFDMPGINVVMVHSSLRSGVLVENLTPQLGEFFGVKNGGGVLVRSVEKGSRAEKAGLHAGDVIVKVNGRLVHDTSDFSQALRSLNGGTVGVGVVRDKKEQNLNLTLPERKESGENLEEEGLEHHILDADTYQSLSQVQDEIAGLRPQLELAMQDAVKSSVEVRQTLCEQQKQIRQQAEQLKKQLQPRIQQQLRHEQEKLRQEMRQMRLDMQGGLEI